MYYLSCRVCNGVIEYRASWMAYSSFKDHLENKHQNIWKEIEKDIERYNKEKEPFEIAISKIKPALDWHEFLLEEHISKKDGRKEYKDRIINL
jgi:hypothetical protein